MDPYPLESPSVPISETGHTDKHKARTLTLSNKHNIPNKETNEKPQYSIVDKTLNLHHFDFSATVKMRYTDYVFWLQRKKTESLPIPIALQTQGMAAIRQYDLAVHLHANPTLFFSFCINFRKFSPFQLVLSSIPDST